MPILPEGSNINQFAAPDVTIIEKKPPTIIGERAVRVVGLIGDFTWGPELEATTCSTFEEFKRYFGGYKSTMKGWLDAASMFDQGIKDVKIVRAIPADGDAVKASYTVSNQNYYIDDAGGVLRFYATQHGTTGGAVTVKIEDGSVSGKKITINEGEANEEVFDNIDMDETVPASYIVDVINDDSSGSVLVRVERLTAVDVDTLPTNQAATRLDNDSTTLDQDIIKFEAATAGLDGNSLYITITSNGTTDNRVDVTIIDLVNEQTEVFTSMHMDDSDSSNYVVDKINATSSLVDVTREDTNALDLLPRTLNNQELTGGSDGGLKYAEYTATSAIGDNIVKFQSKYRGSNGNNISVKIVNNTSTVDVYISDAEGRVKIFKKLTMNESDSRYLVDVINNSSNGSKAITAERLSISTDTTLPKAVSTFTNLSGGGDGDPIDDTSIQNAIDVFDTIDYIDVITYGSQSNGTANANAKALRTLCENKRERVGIVNSDSGATNSEAITFADDVTSEFIIVTHPEMKIINPSTELEDSIAYAAAYAGRLGTLSFETSPSRKTISNTLGNTIDISLSGNNATANELTVGGVSPVGFIKGMGYVILNGINSGGDETTEQISTVCMRAFIARSLYNGLQPLVSKLHTSRYRAVLKSVVESYLLRLFREGRIGDPNSESPRDAFHVDFGADLNPKEIIEAKTVRGRVQVVLLAPADHIVLELEAGESVRISY